MKRVLVTGGNKGIGFGMVEGLLKQGCYVFLGSRDVNRGSEAVKSLDKAQQKRVEVVQLDVTNDESVKKAAEVIALKCGDDKLFCLVNNAGGVVNARTSLDARTHREHADTVELNYDSVVRVTTKFLPLLGKSGRVVMMSSGGAPSFVQKLPVHRQKLFLAVEEQTKITLSQLQALIDEIHLLSEIYDSDTKAYANACKDAGLGDGDAYGLSKACVNAYATILARENPGMKINACSPGFIETDLTRPLAAILGKPAAEIGCKPVEAGTVAPLYLALDESIPGSGWFFGSDAKRSPPHLYREPGTVAYRGDGKFDAASTSKLFNDPSKL